MTRFVKTLSTIVLAAAATFAGAAEPIKIGVEVRKFKRPFPDRGKTQALYSNLHTKTA